MYWPANSIAARVGRLDNRPSNNISQTWTYLRITVRLRWRQTSNNKYCAPICLTSAALARLTLVCRQRTKGLRNKNPPKTLKEKCFRAVVWPTPNQTFTQKPQSNACKMGNSWPMQICRRKGVVECILTFVGTGFYLSRAPWDSTRNFQKVHRSVIIIKQHERV